MCVNNTILSIMVVIRLASSKIWNEYDWKNAGMGKDSRMQQLQILTYHQASTNIYQINYPPYILHVNFGLI